MISLDPVFETPEPAFHPLSGYALQVGRSDRAMLNHLSACVEVKPNNLLFHTRRILVAIELKDTEEIFGALVDLFIAKGGESLVNIRTNLLQRATTLLTTEQERCLMVFLATGIDVQAPITAPRSRLTAGMLDVISSEPQTS